jgi:hypothetical protein
MKKLRRTPFLLCLILPVLLLCFACQSGKLPCPHVKAPKAKRTNINKRNLQYASARRGQAEIEEEAKSQSSNGGRSQDPRFIKHVTLEEWDCPHPGEKRYMPKSVKNNIRRNMQRINEDRKKGEASDSTRYNR